MKKAVTFDDFSFCCPFFNSKVGNGYGCTHPEQEEIDKDAEGKEYGKCYCFSCPLGIEAEQEDLSEKTIDWDGLCECGEVTEGEYLLVDVGNEATDDQKNALYSYERYIFDFGDLFRVSDKYEVIGNIHDNPELLDGAGNG